jgi:hypothetical protein
MADDKQYYSSCPQIAYFKAAEGLHSPHQAAQVPNTALLALLRC